jgi:hypothetical protein
MDDLNWEDIAKNILEQEKRLKTYNYPAPISVLLTWREDVYIGSIQECAPGFSDEIVVLSKSTSKLPYDLVGAIRKLDEKRLELAADGSLDLEGRQHILRRLENRLILLTPEQTKHMVENMPNVVEI